HSEERWSFLTPWTAVLRKQLRHCASKTQDGIFGTPQLFLSVVIPNESVQQDTEDQNVSEDAQSTHEGLKLLAAVAHVSYDAWRYFLTHYCGVVLGYEGDETFEAGILVQYKLTMYGNTDTYVSDLVQMCGPQQHQNYQRIYMEALAEIAAMDERLKQGKDIEILVKMLFYPNIWNRKGRLDELLMVRDALELIRQQRAEWGGKWPSVRCTFLLEPMETSFNQCVIDMDMVKMLEAQRLDDVWFSLEYYTKSRVKNELKPGIGAVDDVDLWLFEPMSRYLAGESGRDLC
ncbi:hypothetical protein L915_02847, partial [Phytophthora nicotianae]